MTVELLNGSFLVARGLSSTGIDTLAIDPGEQHCGVAWFDELGVCVWAEEMTPAQLLGCVRGLCENGLVKHLVVEDSANTSIHGTLVEWLTSDALNAEQLKTWATTGLISVTEMDAKVAVERAAAATTPSATKRSRSAKPKPKSAIVGGRLAATPKIPTRRKPEPALTESASNKKPWTRTEVCALAAEKQNWCFLPLTTLEVVELLIDDKYQRGRSIVGSDVKTTQKGLDVCASTATLLSTSPKGARIIAIDPGDVHCGMAIFADGRCQDAFELNPADCLECLRVLFEAKLVDTVVVEEFRLYLPVESSATGVLADANV